MTFPLDVEALLKWLPLVNTVLIPLVGFGVRRLGRIDQRLSRHDELLLQMKTVCKLTHPERADLPSPMTRAEDLI